LRKRKTLKRTKIQKTLLRWFARNERDLPWRKTKDPYAIWVSEIMLQQTQVRTVVPYYERFLRRFPTVESLARARLDTILKLWEGLGYYSRARNLHRAAKEVVKQFGGQFPRTAAELLTLPGIGRYTAGAIASNAFDERAPIVDGNIERVLCRVFRIHGYSKAAAVQKTLWAIADDLVPAKKPGLFNQALMEIGADVCTPRNPQCGDCPLSQVCQARLHNEQLSLPQRRAKKPLPSHIVAVGLIYKAGRILIDKRKPDGLLGGLWEFPGGKKEPGESLEAALLREVREELAITIRVRRPLTVVDHACSHFRVRIHAFECTWVSGEPRCIACDEFKWIRLRDIARYAFPAANKKIIQALRAQKPRKHQEPQTR
jgi:A/G-specific adenine glycosylase